MKKRRLDFCSKILWTNESKFDNDDMTNYHTLHFWAQKDHRNLQKKIRKNFLGGFSLKVWMGIMDDNLMAGEILYQTVDWQMIYSIAGEERHGVFVRGHMKGLVYDFCPVSNAEKL